MLQIARNAMRTRFEVVLADGGDEARLRAAGEEALDEVECVEAWLSAFRDDAELFRINAIAAQQAVRVDPRVLGLLATAQELHAATAGAFDLAVGALLACWHHAGMAEGAGAVPGEQAIAEARAACGMGRNVVLDQAHGTVRFARSGVRLDPGAIGKGWALDRAAAVLREAGIAGALLHGGTSTAYGLGRPADQPAWLVAVRDPRDDDRVVASAGLRDAALSVSAVHGRSFTAGGRRYGHVIDPRSGWPVQGALLAAVVHPSALLSDALSTALLVLGHEGLPLLAGRYPEAGFLLVTDLHPSTGAGVETAGDGFSLGMPVHPTG